MWENILSWLPFFLLVVLFYFLILRPQQVQKKNLKEIQSNLTKGDEVTTIGGIIGILVDFDKKTITLQTAESSNIKLEHEGIKSIKKEDGTIKNV